MRKLHFIYFLGVISLFGAVFMTSDVAEAASGNCFFRQTNYYVSGTGTCATDSQYGDYAVNDVFTGRDRSGGGRAMPTSAVGSKEQFINYIVSRFNSSNVQDRVGASFVIQKMRGVNTWPTSADVADWQNRMNDPAITYHSLSTTVATSSWYDPDKRNVFTANRPAPREIVEIRYGTQVIIQVIRDCGNPTARQDTDLPTPKAWSVSSESRLHAPSMSGSSGQWDDARNRPTQTVYVGQPITFWHKLNNTGNSNITGNFTVYVQSYTQAALNPSTAQSSTNAPTSYGSSWNTTLVQSKEIDAGKDVHYHPSYTGDRGAAMLSRTAQQSEVGSYVCQRISTLSAQGSGVWQYSSPACVRVVAAPWTTAGTSSRTVNNSNTGTGTPGQIIRWTHALTLSGGSNTAAISRNTHLSGFSNGWNGNTNSGTIAVGRPAGTILSIGSSAANRTQYTITQNDVGNNLCQQLQWTPTNGNGGTNGRSTAACVNVPYNYRLTPDLTSSTSFDGGAVEPGTSLDINRIVRNAGPTKSRDAEWRMVEVVVRQGSGIPNQGGGTSTQAPCSTYFRPANGSCDEIDSGTGRVFNPSDQSLGPITRTIGDLNVGDRICWALSVRAHAHNSPANEWRHSQLYCLTVGKTPKVQLWGGDVRSGSAVSTSVSNISGRMYGSWAEYAIMSTGTVSSSSGAGLSSGSTGRGVVAELDRNKLTFANTYTGTPVFGNLNTTVPTSIVPSSYTDTSGTSVAANSTIDVAATSSGVYRSTGNLTISGGEVVAGKNLVIKALTGTVTITGDITYANGPYTDMGALPQLVVSARRIIIADNVTTVNAWLVARGGYVSTCNTPPTTGGWVSDLNSTVCNQRLAINGPVIADRLYLRRTFGSDTSHRGSPAEILNLRPDTYLQNQAVASDSSAIGTQYLQELPPRF